MPKFFVKNDQVKENLITINNSDVNHIKNVLRLNVEDEIIICNSDTSKDYLTNIFKITDEQIVCKIIKELDSNSESNVYINILQGLPKADKMELIIQKCTELGVKEITPVEMGRCVVKLDEKTEKKKNERWQKIAEIAAKQSGRNSITKINHTVKLKNIFTNLKDYDIILVAYENEKIKTLKSVLKSMETKANLKIAILIGPEGGFDPKEIEYLAENNAEIITLGKRILRTETVSIVVASIIMYELENIGGNFES